jgi:hypothetical protein
MKCTLQKAIFSALKNPDISGTLEQVDMHLAMNVEVHAKSIFLRVLRKHVRLYSKRQLLKKQPEHISTLPNSNLITIYDRCRLGWNTV